MPGTLEEPKPDLMRSPEDMRQEYLDNITKGYSQPRYRVDTESLTWKAIKQEIQRLNSTDYMNTLRSKNKDHGQTQYARGAMDALDCLLQFGGEEV